MHPLYLAFYDPRPPGPFVLGMELEPANFARGSSSFVHADLGCEPHCLIRRKIQRFELCRLFRRQADQNTVFSRADEISAGASRLSSIIRAALAHDPGPGRSFTRRSKVRTKAVKMSAPRPGAAATGAGYLRRGLEWIRQPSRTTPAGTTSVVIRGVIHQLHPGKVERLA